MKADNQRALGRVLPLLLLIVAAPATALEVPGPLVDTEWLAKNQDQVVVLDVRRDPQGFIRKAGAGEVGGVQACGAKAGGGGVSGHIPGAALIEWKEIAVKQKADGVELYDTVPDGDAFAKLMQQSGVNQDSAVVVVNPGDGAPAVADGTRLYWTLKYYGHDNVALLDGGVAKWAAEKRPIEYGRTKAGAGNWQAGAPREGLLATLAQVQAATTGEGTQIIDVRTPEFYLGLTHKADKVAARATSQGPRTCPSWST
jgi:thiosulfate/3-mercaptopyruvate sulfurtransferase